MGYAKMKLYDNGENGERIVLSLHLRQWEGYQDFHDNSQFSGRGFDIANFFKTFRSTSEYFGVFKTIEAAQGILHR
jgi:hypothetical protein